MYSNVGRLHFDWSADHDSTITWIGEKMSGGSFEYRDNQLDYLADDIIHKTEGCDIEPEVQDHAKKLAKRLRKLRKEIKMLDYYLAGDTSEYK